MKRNAIYCSGLLASLVFLLKRCSVSQKPAVVRLAITLLAVRACKAAPPSLEAEGWRVFDGRKYS